MKKKTTSVNINDKMITQMKILKKLEKIAFTMLVAFTFTAYYTGQNTGETICVKGRFRHSQPTVYPIGDTPSSYSTVNPIE